MPIPVRWEIARPLPARDALAQVLGVDPVVAQVLIARGYDSADRARAFLDAPLDSLPDPDGIVDVPAAAERLVRALRTHEPITMYGDYDADGVSATSILHRGLHAMGGVGRLLFPFQCRDGHG